LGTISLQSLLLPERYLEAKAEKLLRQATAAHKSEWLTCLSDPAYFIDTYAVIDEPQGSDVATVPFHLWPAQVDVLAQLVAEKLVVILKARQLGISWLCCAYVLWLCLFHPGRVVLLLSKGEVEANELSRRIKVMYARLPDWMRAKAPLHKSNDSEIAWTNESRVQSLAATRNAGRSFTASLVLMDEFAFMQWGEEVYTAVKPTIDAGGQLIIVSTANGEGDSFHQRWQDAEAGANHFAPIFLPWQARPGRDDAWRAARAAEAINPTADLQEYPATPIEAFQNTGADRYLPSIALWDSCQGELPAVDAKWPMVLGMDAGVTNDCFALVGVSRHPQRKDDAIVRYVRKWEPVHGRALDFDAIEKEIIDTVLSRFNVVEIAFDMYQLAQMSQRLGTKVWARPFSQQSERMVADASLLQMIMRRAVLHDGHSDLRAHLDAADRKAGEEADKLRIVKRENSKHVDLAVALSMATRECMRLAL
jgi:phage terminase large subunit-like protein